MKKLLKWLKWVVLTIVMLVLIVLLPFGVNTMYQKVRASSLTKQEKYFEDIDRLEYVMKNEFAGYRSFNGSDSFEAMLKELRNKVKHDAFPSQTAFNLSIIKTVASFKDPHTFVYNKNELLDLRYPFYLDWSEGSFYLLSGQVDKKWLGAEVLQIGDSSSEEVFKKLKAYTNAPNEAGTAFFMRSAVYSPDILFEEGIVKNPEQIDLVVNLNGEKATLKFKSMSRTAFSALPDYHGIGEKFNAAELPLFMQNSDQNYWYEYLEKDNILYLRYSMCVAQGDIEAFWNEVFSMLEKTQPDKFIIDVRGNPGGDTQNHTSFINRLKNNLFINHYGKLFTLIDRGTGSAAVSFASDMESMTETILVGEKTMDKPNTTSDPTFYTLPHSGVTILVPSLYSLHSYSSDNRDAVYPDIPITQKLKGADYSKDEIMDSLIHWNIDLSRFSYANLPASVQGQYSFSPVRNASLTQRDSVWYFSIDGLIDTPIFENDSAIFTKKYNITFTKFDSFGKKVSLDLHGKEIELDKTNEDYISLEKSILNRNFQVTENILENMLLNDNVPYYLDRPYFQQRVYRLYREYGFDEAMALNQIVKKLYPIDPVVSIIDYELNQYKGSKTGQAKAIFPVIGKLLNRYFTVLTTDKVMNDHYNPFIGK